MINPETATVLEKTSVVMSSSSLASTLLEYFIIALFVSLLWNIIAKKEYDYNKKFPKILGMSSFPLIMWTVGLFTMMIIFDFIAHALALQSFFIQLIVFAIAYWILLLAGETIGYHVFNIHNKSVAKYPGIPILNCLHAPTWMKIAYFSNGIIMFLVCKAFGIAGLFV